MSLEELASTARALVAPSKGILAADESFPTIEKRFRSIGLESTEESRRAYREMLFTTEGLEENISGVILFDETLRQKARDGRPLARVLSDRGIIPGIKVDRGAKALPFAPGERVTEGLDGLRGRLEEYRGLGARFTKWRAVIAIGEGMPSAYCIDANAHALARFAALSQEAGLVPIVEPEVLMTGDHGIEEHFRATRWILRGLYEQLFRQRVELEGTLLKTNMVLSGDSATERAGVEEVAGRTVRCLRQAVPPAVPGVVFLSGGQSEEEATVHLQAINERGPHPWELSYSYGRALQASALEAWKGKAENVPAAQAALRRRARLNGAARDGRFRPEMEKELAAS